MITTARFSSEDALDYKITTHDIIFSLPPRGHPQEQSNKILGEPEKKQGDSCSKTSFDYSEILRERAKEIITMTNIIKSYESALKAISKRNTDLSYEVEGLEINNVFLEKDNLTKQRILDSVGKGKLQEMANYSLRKKEEIKQLQD